MAIAKDKKRITVTLDKKTIDKLQALCNEIDVTPSVIIKLALNRMHEEMIGVEIRR